MEQAVLKALPSSPPPSPERVAVEIQKKLGLQPLDSRPAIKQAVRKLDPVMEGMKELWKSENSQIQSGVCTVLGQMALENTICKRLFKDGIVAYFARLLSLPANSLPLQTLLPLVRTLSVLTSYGHGESGLKEKSLVVEMCSGSLVKLANGRNDIEEDGECFALIIVSLAHSSLGLFTGDFANSAPLRSRLKHLSIPAKSLCQLMSRACRHPDPHVHCHALDGVRSIVGYLSKEDRRGIPEVGRGLVGHLRDGRVWTRTAALAGIGCWNYTPAIEQNLFNIYGLADAVKDGGPNVIFDGHIVESLKTNLEFQNLMKEITTKGKEWANNNACMIGSKIHKLLMRNEFAIVDGFFQIESKIPHPFTNEPQYREMPNRLNPLPFTRFAESLDFGANALRRRDERHFKKWQADKEKEKEKEEGGKEEGKEKDENGKGKGLPDRFPHTDLTKAVCLELKAKIMRREYATMLDVVEPHLDLESDCAYLYYCAAMGREPTYEGLKWAKKGLKCQGLHDTGGYIELGLLQNSVQYSTKLMFEIINDDSDVLPHDLPDSQRAAFVQALIEDGLADGLTYMEKARDDQKGLRSVILEVILLKFLLEGKKIGKEVKKDKEMKKLFDRLKAVDKFSEPWGKPVATNMRLSVEFIQQHYEDAAREWDPIFRSREAAGRPPDIEAVSARLSALTTATSEDQKGLSKSERDELIGKLADGKVTSELLKQQQEEGDEDGGSHHLHPRMNAKHITMLKCSFCGNPCATLKACSRCGVTRYCDGRCQKRDWKRGHKDFCKPVKANQKGRKNKAKR